MSIAVSDLLNIAAAAEHVGCSPATIRYRIVTRRLAPTFTLGRAYFFTAADLNAHFEEMPLQPYGRRRET